MGELFGISQSQANEWMHTLLPVLKQALNDLGYEPERDPKKFKKSELGQEEADAVWHLKFLLARHPGQLD